MLMVRPADQVTLAPAVMPSDQVTPVAVIAAAAVAVAAEVAAGEVKMGLNQ